MLVRTEQKFLQSDNPNMVKMRNSDNVIFSIYIINTILSISLKFYELIRYAITESLLTLFHMFAGIFKILKKVSLNSLLFPSFGLLSQDELLEVVP